MKYVRGSTFAIARRNGGNECGEKNEPEMNAIGRETALTAPHPPWAERTTTVIPRPSAANASAPSRSVSTSEIQRWGRGTEKSPRPIAIMHAELAANAMSVDASTAMMYADEGSGVARTRLRIPDS